MYIQKTLAKPVMLVGDEREVADLVEIRLTRNGDFGVLVAICEKPHGFDFDSESVQSQIYHVCKQVGIDVPNPNTPLHSDGLDWPWCAVEITWGLDGKPWDAPGASAARELLFDIRWVL